MRRDPDFWSLLAPDLAAIEDSYLDLASLGRVMPDIQPPALVVGAGQGLISRNYGAAVWRVRAWTSIQRWSDSRRGGAE